MTLVEKKLQKYRHLYDRLSEIIQFKTFIQADVADIVNQLCEVEITEKGIELIHSRANRFRQIVKIINKVESVATANNLTSINENIIKEILKNDSRQSFENNQRAKHILAG